MSATVSDCRESACEENFSNLSANGDHGINSNCDEVRSTLSDNSALPGNDRDIYNFLRRESEYQARRDAWEHRVGIVNSGNSRTTGRRRRSRRRVQVQGELISENSKRRVSLVLCSLVSIVCLTVAFVLPSWINISAWDCSLSALNLYMFLGVKNLSVTTDFSDNPHIAKIDYVLHHCFPVTAVPLLNLCAALLLCGCVCALGDICLRLCRPRQKFLKFCIANALLGTLQVFLCVSTCACFFWISEMVESFLLQTRKHKYSKVEVWFGSAFYVMVVAGGAAVFNVAFAVLHRYTEINITPRTHPSQVWHSDTDVLINDDSLSFGDAYPYLTPANRMDNTTPLPPLPEYSP